MIEIVVPPLRKRKGDIPLLARHLLAKIALKLHRSIDGISDEAMRRLESYDWPGNVRELENTLTRAAVLARGPIIDAEQVSVGMLEVGGESSASDTREGRAAGEVVSGERYPPRSGAVELAAAEAGHIRRILDRTGGNKRQAARLLAISRQRLDRLLKKHGLWPGSGPSDVDS